MTHPDDEISVAGTIHRLLERKREVYLSWTHSNPTRTAEARAAFEKAGVPAQNLTFMDAADGQVAMCLSELKQNFVDLMAQVKPDRVVCGAFEQGHLDHDGTNFLVSQTFDGPIFEAPFYHTYLTRMPRVARFADSKGQELLRLTPVERAFKISLAKSYPSQRIWWNLCWAELRARLTGDGSLTWTERLRLQTHHDFRAPNVPEHLRARVEQSPQWNTWLQAMDQW